MEGTLRSGSPKASLSKQMSRWFVLVASVVGTNKGSQPLVPQNDLVNEMEVNKYFCKPLPVTTSSESCKRCVFICESVCRCSASCGILEDGLLFAGSSQRRSPRPAAQVGVARGSPRSACPQPHGGAPVCPVCCMAAVSFCACRVKKGLERPVWERAPDRALLGISA